MPRNPYRPWDTPNVHAQVKRVIFYIAYHPWQSASQIAKALNLKSATVSGALKILSDKKVVVRKPGCGPRGGMGYNLEPSVLEEFENQRRVPNQSPTWYDRLLRELDSP